MHAEVAVDEELWFGSPGDDKELEDRAAKSMAAVAARVLGAKPFPPAARKLEELTRAGGAKIEQVVGVLESDPGLSMRLLRLVNSAGYALRVRCTSVRHAAALVGMRRLHQLATTAAVLDLFETNNPAVSRLLSHAAVVGAFCRYLAVHVDLAPDELFTCGFLHDIGKLMLMDAEGQAYLDLVDKAGESPDALHLLEQEKFGFDHAVLGAHVLKNWRIPNPVPRVVAWHHNVARAYQADPAIAAMVQTLRLADQMSYLVRTHAEAEGVVLAAQSPAASYLGVSEAQLSSMWGDLARLSERIISPGGTDQAEIIPRENSMPPSLRPRGKSKLPNASIPPGATVSPAGPISEMPKHFVCVVCNKASFGNRCPVCSGHVCAEHQVGAEQWCTECTTAYAVEVGKNGFPLWERLTAGGIVVGAGLLSLIVALLAGRPVLGALFGSVLLSTLCVLLVLVGRRFWLKKVFFQTRAQSHASDEPTLPLGLTMPPEPSIAMLSDMPDITMRPTERINPAVEANGLPALFSMAPTSLDVERGLLPVSEPPPALAEPIVSAAPAADPRTVSVPPVPARPPNGMYDDAPQISVRPAYDTAPHLSARPLNGTHTEPTGNRAQKAAVQRPNIHFGDPTSVAPALFAIDDHGASAAPAPVRPEPRTDAHAESELPAADGWRPVERTEPAMPLSRRGDKELRRLAEALPSIPPAVEPPAHAGAASVLASAEAPATKSVTEVPPPFEPKTNTVPIPAPEKPLAAAPTSPVAALAVDTLQDVAGRLSQAAPNVDVRLSEAASCEPMPQPSLPAPVFVPETCNAVAPTLLVACRPASLRPRHYACSPAGGR
jgi:putative nucleotidyltransferase with HDIG domain